jgi:hypothetical protein
LTKIVVGLKHLPKPIREYLLQSVSKRPVFPHVYHVSSLIGGARKLYYKRMFPKDSVDLKNAWGMFRGNTFDELFTRLFEVNQKSYVVQREDISIVGTLDFVYFDKECGERFLCDLKMPKSILHKKESGAGSLYIKQCLSYLNMAHLHNELLDVNKVRIYMLAEDLCYEEVEEDDAILNNFLWPRAFIIDRAIRLKKPEILPCPEERWECNFCEADEEFKKKYCHQKNLDLNY